MPTNKMKRITKIRPSSFRSFHLNPSNVIINPIIISTNNAREQMAPADETGIGELLTTHAINHGKGFLKRKKFEIRRKNFLNRID